MTATEAPVGVEPDALGAFDLLTAMDAGQHKTILTPPETEGMPLFYRGADRAGIL
jgi:hypothetical protein